MGEVLGVTVGKFYPPHRGHAHLIETALAQCGRLVVIVCDRPDQSLRGSLRAGWLAELFPDATFVVTPDDLPESPEPWALRALEILGRRPDVAFTSEGYGEPWAFAMGARHVSVDFERRAVPVSGTAIRGDLAGHFDSLIAPARRDLTRNVVVVGAESSGTTTLATDLAQALGSVCVPEYGRDYWVERTAARPTDPWTTQEFVHIASEHHRLGALVAERSTGTTVWDTDALATAVWHRRYLGRRSVEVEAIAAAHVPDLYVVSAPDFPFVQDGTREDGPHREEMHEWFKEAVAATGVPWIEVGGSREARLERALEALHDLPSRVLV